MTVATLRVVLGDQLSRSMSSLTDLDPATDIVLMAEVMEEATYVRHHPKKIAFLFSAMRHFADGLRRDGVAVDYRRLDDPDNGGSLTAEVEQALSRHRVGRIVVTHPGEYRVARDLEAWRTRFGIPVEIREDDRFVCSRRAFARWAEGRRQLRMEFFYREMRRRTGLLMDGNGEPEGGQWNFDADNRKRLPENVTPPKPFRVEPDAITREVLHLVSERFPAHFGDPEPFWFAVTAEDAERSFERFLHQGLPGFGDYQDAMRRGEPTLFHSVAGLYLNAGLLDPLAMCRKVEAEYRRGRVPLNAAEGFIRQIIGWREYVRGIYWLEMPAYAQRNFLDAHRPLPDFYWTGQTDMACLKDVIDQTRREAYAHHIQRLMVTGNFALLTGVEPREIHEWYLAVYADAYEWVELPNVHGMVMHADGGRLGSKPYAASGQYINRMSDYCRGCRYDVKSVTGPRACPFNYLYWNFLIENRPKLGGNARLKVIYASLDRMTEDRRTAIRASAGRFLDKLAVTAHHESADAATHDRGERA